MLILKGRYLEARELPAKEPYPPSAQVSILVGTQTSILMASREVLNELEDTEEFTDVIFDCPRQLRLDSFGGSGNGNAYRLSIRRLLNPEALS